MLRPQAGEGRLRFACLVSPHTGGTWTVFENLRAGLAHFDIQLTWLHVGELACDYSEIDPQVFNYGKIVGAGARSDAARAAALKLELECGDYRGVIANVLSDRCSTNVVRYIRSELVRLMVVHSTSRGTYSAARAMRDFVDLTVCVSPRICEDLQKKYGFSKQETLVIPNGIVADLYRVPPTMLDQAKLRVLVLGRIEDSSKGILWVPDILGKVPSNKVDLTIAGDGPDLHKLRQKCRKLGIEANFTGIVGRDEIPKLIRNHDVLLFPSRYEGFGQVLVEAMAGGCVPVASNIAGVTDFIIKDGRTGFLYPIGDTNLASAAIASLENDRGLLRRMSVEAREDVLKRFSHLEICRAYAQVLTSLIAIEKRSQSLTINDWEYPAGLRPVALSYLPEGIKRPLRAARERWRASK